MDFLRRLFFVRMILVGLRGLTLVARWVAVVESE